MITLTWVTHILHCSTVYYLFHHQTPMFIVYELRRFKNSVMCLMVIITKKNFYIFPLGQFSSLILLFVNPLYKISINSKFCLFFISDRPYALFRQLCWRLRIAYSTLVENRDKQTGAHRRWLHGICCKPLKVHEHRQHSHYLFVLPEKANFLLNSVEKNILYLFCCWNLYVSYMHESVVL